MTKTARAVQVPGEPTKPVETTASELPLGTDTGVDTDGAPEPTAAASVDGEVAQLRAQLAAERARNAQLAASANQPAAPKVVRRIGGCELTQAGWIVPADHGAPPKKA